MNGWKWQLKTGFLHDITTILFRLMIIFTELVLYPFSCRAMVLGSFQCRGGRLTTLAYGRAGACCACNRCGTDGLFCFCFLFCFSISSILSSFSNASYLGRRLDILKYRGARWLSGRVSDSGARGPGFETYRRRVVSLSKTLYSPKVLVNYPGSDGSVPTWLKNCWLGR